MSLLGIFRRSCGLAGSLLLLLAILASSCGGPSRESLRRTNLLLQDEIARLGPLGSFEEVSRETIDGDRSVTVSIRFRSAQATDTIYAAQLIESWLVGRGYSVNERTECTRGGTTERYRLVAFYGSIVELGGGQQRRNCPSVEEVKVQVSAAYLR